MIATAVGKDLQTIFISRFFGGFFGACPLTNVGAVFADMFNNVQRGLAITVFSITVFSGPLLAPFIGGFITQSYLGWRWTEYIAAIMGFLGLILELIYLEETYPPVILVNKARELRRRTKNWGIHAKQEEIEVDLRELLEKNLSRPMRMLFTESIVLALSTYMAFIYGLLYLFLTFYPIVFQQIHGFNGGVGGLPFFGMIVGEIIAGGYMLIIQPSYQRKLAANNNIPVPEWRLPPVIIGGVSFTIGLFWFAWTGFRADIPWIVPTLSGLCTGFGLMSIFLNCLNYLIDAYLMFAASAIAANTFLRSLAGAGFPLFATYMIEGELTMLCDLSQADSPQAWVCNGLERCLGAFRSYWCRCQSSSTCVEQRSERRATLHQLSQLPTKTVMRNMTIAQSMILKRARQRKSLSRNHRTSKADVHSNGADRDLVMLVMF